MTGKIHSIETMGTVDGPGLRLVVFFQGCPMRCAYCHNPDTWEIGPGKDTTVDEIMAIYERNKSFYGGGGITVTGGEPLVQIDFVTELFEECHKRGIHTCLDSSGIMFNPNSPVSVEKMDRLIKVTSLVMLDIKHIDPEKHKELTSQPNDGILAYAKYLSDNNVPLWIRHVVVPGITDDPEYLYKLGYFIGGLKDLEALDILPYHTMGKVKYEKLGIPYKLADVPPMEKEDALVCKRHVIDGIKARRADDAAQK